MRILVLAEAYGPGFYTAGIIDGFRAFGHEVHMERGNVWGLKEPSRIREKMKRNEDMITKVLLKDKFDAFFTAKGDAIGGEVLGYMKHKGMTTVVWQIDDPMWFEKVSLRYSPPYDIIYTTEKNSLPLYAKHDLKAYWLPFGYDSIYADKAPTKRYSAWRNSCKIGDFEYEGAEVAFVGDPLVEYPKSWRYKHCVEIKKQVPELQLLGSDRESGGVDKKWGPRIEVPNMKAIIRNTKINLAFSDQAQGVRGLKMRHLEIPGYDGFMMAEDFDYLEELFIPGKEIAVFSGVDECVHEIRHYLKHDLVRMSIQERGYKRAKREHTYIHRARQVLRDIEKYKEDGGLE